MVKYPPSCQKPLKNSEVSLSQICFIAPHNCCAFCQVFIAQCLRFRGLFSISSHLPENGLKRAYHGAPTLWLHISSRPVRILQYSVFKQAFISYALKIILHSKYAKFLPIYKNFFKIFLSKWAATLVSFLDRLTIQLKIHLFISPKQQALPVS